jgi:tetratricopeptide (TPR) repeat protein
MRRGFAIAMVIIGTICLATPVFSGAVEDVKIGSGAMADGDYQKAVEYLSRAIDSGELPMSSLFLIHVARGDAFYAHGNQQAALQDFDKAVTLKPDYPEAYYNRGNLHCLMRQYDKAIEDYTHAIELTENDANAHNNRGMAWHQKGNYESALANYNRAIAINPNEPVFYANRGRLWDRIGDDALARADYLQAKELDPSIKTPID